MKINCGGFEIDENNFELDGKTLKLKNGDSGGGATIVHADITADNPPLDMTAGAIMTAMESGPVILLETAPMAGTVAASPISIARNSSNVYVVKGGQNFPSYSAASADAYPSASGGSGGNNSGSM